MRRFAWVVVGIALGAALTGAAVHFRRNELKPSPDSAAVLVQLREVARLETLDLTLYKKLSFTPDPPAPSESELGDLVHWAKYSLRQPHGRAILFATVHLGLDLSKLDAEHVRFEGSRAWLVLPPVQAQVELDPGATEIIDSNLDSAETAQLLERGKSSFEAEVTADPRLRARARDSAERALRALLVNLGFREVQIVDALPAPASA